MLPNLHRYITQLPRAPHTLLVPHVLWGHLPNNHTSPQKSPAASPTPPVWASGLVLAPQYVPLPSR